MFGHDEDQTTTDNGMPATTDPQASEPVADGALTTDNPAEPTSAPAVPEDGSGQVVTPTVEPTDQPAEPVENPALPPEHEDSPAPVDLPAPEIAPEPLSSEPNPDLPVEEPQTTEPAPETEAPEPTSAPAVGDDDTDDLVSIKQEALQELSPLVSHLDQSPEEKFHTTMMMIQASDDKSLIQSAFAAAKEIPDDKTRAQALLDIINEINYFTQHLNTEQ